MSSLQEVAEAAGVSRSVASRALTGDKSARINAETRTRIIEAARHLGYVANHRARALRQARSGTLALLVPDANNSVFAAMLDGVQEAARAHDYMVLLGEVQAGQEGRNNIIKLLAEGRADGIILQRPETYSDRELSFVIGDSRRVVLINSRLPDREGSVILPDEEGSRVATQHLIDLGHERIGHLSGRHHHDTARRRQKGFTETMNAAGLSLKDSWMLEAGWEAAGGNEAMRQILSGAELPTAVVVSSVNAACGALAAAQRAGLRVPEDLSIVTINDTWFAETLVPALTTVRMPLRELGNAAAEMLLSSFSGQKITNLTVQNPAPVLVIRESTSPPHMKGSNLTN